jgi:hypothetical protein
LPGTSTLPEPANASQIGAHSYDPGISANALFWTVPIPEDSIDVHLGAGEAVLEAANIPLFDAFTVANSFSKVVPRVSAVIDSLLIEWSGIKTTTQFSDSTDQFAGYFLENSATIEVTATTPASGALHGFRFVSNAGSTSTSHFAQVGHDHNGAFFPG